MASLSICKSDLRQQIVNHIAEDELYEKIKDKLQQQILEKRYEGYKLEEDGLLTYKGIMKSIKLRILVTRDIKRQLLQLESSTSGQE